MHVGMLTNSLFGVGETDIVKVADWAAASGFKEIEWVRVCLWTSAAMIR